MRRAEAAGDGEVHEGALRSARQQSVVQNRHGRRQRLRGHEPHGFVQVVVRHRTQRLREQRQSRPGQFRSDYVLVEGIRLHAVHGNLPRR